ncbi:hypothetical protein [Accumulibacter sp.]|jgi:hypothetical protein|uniref:hypothetical protein n=1 Tax=Accumulibacter sp. TaxID=2053492 RepID=UPI00260F9998|nr:hypothetical protein [Accumulibacter sp.]
MLTWLLVFGVGGCWSGYTDATVIQAPDRDTAWRQGLDIALKETADERRLSFKGCSFDIELVEGDVRECSNYLSRCKPGAKVLAELAFDALEVTHG